MRLVSLQPLRFSNAGLQDNATQCSRFDSLGTVVGYTYLAQDICLMTNVIIMATVSVVKSEVVLFQKFFYVCECPVVYSPRHLLDFGHTVHVYFIGGFNGLV
jgi:hypothetical protein